MSDVAQKSHSQSVDPSSSSAEERGVEDSRVPTGGEPEHDNDHGAALTAGDAACPLVPAAQLSHDVPDHDSAILLAAISTAALGNTRTAQAQRIPKGHPYYTAAYGDVCLTVDREIVYREALQSIAANSCCAPCREAALVAQSALREAMSAPVRAALGVPLVGNGSVPAQEQAVELGAQRKNTDSHFVPSLPSADGSIAQARESLLNAITAYGNHDQRWRVRPATEAAVDHLILLCQSEAQQEIARLTKELALTQAHDKAIVEEYKARWQAAESLAAERQQEIGDLNDQLALVRECMRAATKRAEAAESLLQEQRITEVQEQQDDLGAQSATADVTAGNVSQGQLTHAAAEICPWCDGMGADVDAEQIQTGAHSASWVGSISKCGNCDGSGRVSNR